ncbi:sunset domain-containing protein [Saccharopolyspora gregorii]|uniref:sunset domain-containing protein n=1 Tax=Saccharopolyspora gregorii TaxID=33914 RepID=UPI0021ACC2D6|nr:hypothetical protein [Saccharopolyspora gregorii]
MVWLFTQVWLWSVAAFLLGSVITWLLFVLPLRRRLRKVTSEFTEYVEHQDARHDRQIWRSHQPSPPLGVERTAVQPRWEQDAGQLAEPDEDDEPRTARLPEPERPTAPAAQTSAARTPAAQPAAEPAPTATTDARAEVSVRGGSQVADLVVDDGATSAHEPAEQPARTPGDPSLPVRNPGAWKDDSPYAGRSSGGWWPSRVREDEDGGPRPETAQRPEQSPRPEQDQRPEQPQRSDVAQSSRQPAGAPWTIPNDQDGGEDAERPTSADIGQALGRGANTEPVADRPAESASTWFQKNAAADESEIARPARSAAPTGDGTEIFTRPETPLRPGPPGLSGAAELSAALGLSDLSDAPRPAAEVPRDAEPAREPEAEPTWTEPEPARAGDDHGFAGNLRALVESRAHEFTDQAAPEQASDVPVIAESEQTPLPRRTPGAGPRPGMQQRPGRSQAAWHADPQAQANRRRESLAAPQEPSQQDGHMVKGDFASRRYHAPDSPHYDRVVAEVWFRTEADAEEAGFQHWNSGS